MYTVSVTFEKNTPELFPIRRQFQEQKKQQTDEMDDFNSKPVIFLLKLQFVKKSRTKQGILFKCGYSRYYKSKLY